jgi:hypothetical protein
VAEWQTHLTQNQAIARSCGFESRPRYHALSRMCEHRRVTRHRTRRFIGYPVDRLLAAFRDPTEAAAAAAELRAAGTPIEDIEILRGDEGAARLDGSGTVNGPFTRLRRLLSFTLMDQLPDFAWYEATVRDGGAVLMVRARGDANTRAALRTIRAHDGHFANYYGRFATEELDAWHGPEPDLPSMMRR